MTVSEGALRSSETGVGPQDERPLTEYERRQVVRLFSDPFAFPQSFKTWLISFLEGSDLTLPLSSVAGLVNLLGVTGGSSTSVIGLLPAGVILPWAAPALPDGTLLCDGHSVTKTDFERLWLAIGYAFGGSGENFNVPDLRGRVPVGLGTHADVDALGDSESLAVGSRRPAHKHTVGQPAISAPAISHGLTLPNHKHAITDLGHKHASPGSANIATFNSGNSEIPSGDGPINRTLDTDVKSTGITVENPTTLPAIPGSITAGAPTASGGTVGPQTGNEPTDSAAFLTLNFIIVA